MVNEKHSEIQSVQTIDAASHFVASKLDLKFVHSKVTSATLSTEKDERDYSDEIMESLGY